MGERNTSRRQPLSPRERVESLLAVAAQIWVDDVVSPPGPGVGYSTVGNEFLHVAEAAWFDAAAMPRSPA